MRRKFEKRFSVFVCFLQNFLLQLFGIFFYGGVFLINTQVAAIAIYSVFNALLVRSNLGIHIFPIFFSQKNYT